MLYLFIAIVQGLFLFESTGLGFLKINKNNVSMGPVEEATDMRPMKCGSPSFGLTLEDTISGNALDHSDPTAVIVASKLSAQPTQCFKLVLTPQSKFVVMQGDRCLVFFKDLGGFKRNACNLNPTFFDVYFETSVQRVSHLPPESHHRNDMRGHDAYKNSRSPLDYHRQGRHHGQNHGKHIRSKNIDHIYEKDLEYWVNAAKGYSGYYNGGTPSWGS